MLAITVTKRDIYQKNISNLRKTCWKTSNSLYNLYTNKYASKNIFL